MKLYLLRHGHADWPGWTAPDEDRPLTEEGIREMRTVAAALKRLNAKPDIILSSPLPRALLTATIAGQALGAPMEKREALAPGFAPAGLGPLLAGREGADVMLAGHEPDFSGIIHALTGGRVKFPKGASAAIEIGSRLEGARLLWLFPAKALIHLYGGERGSDSV